MDIATKVKFPYLLADLHYQLTGRDVLGTQRGSDAVCGCSLRDVLIDAVLARQDSGYKDIAALGFETVAAILLRSDFSSIETGFFTGRPRRFS
jgi:hypothetical protein